METVENMHAEAPGPHQLRILVCGANTTLSIRRNLDGRCLAEKRGNTHKVIVVDGGRTSLASTEGASRDTLIKNRHVSWELRRLPCRSLTHPELNLTV